MSAQTSEVCGGLSPATTPGSSIEIWPESLSEFAVPDGTGWWKEEVPE